MTATTNSVQPSPLISPTARNRVSSWSPAPMKSGSPNPAPAVIHVDKQALTTSIGEDQIKVSIGINVRHGSANRPVLAGQCDGLAKPSSFRKTRLASPRWKKRQRSTSPSPSRSPAKDERACADGPNSSPSEKWPVPSFSRYRLGRRFVRRRHQDRHRRQNLPARRCDLRLQPRWPGGRWKKPMPLLKNRCSPAGSSGDHSAQSRPDRHHCPDHPG